MPCEMCGSDGPLKKATIEGTIMSVCAKCARFGVEVAGHAAEVTGRSRVTESLENRARRSRPRDVYDQMQEDLIPEYGDVVREARVRKGFQTSEELAKHLNEKKSTIDKIEGGTMNPSDALVKKLERALDVKLMEKPEAAFKAGGNQVSNKKLTLGDLIKRELEKEK